MRNLIICFCVQVLLSNLTFAADLPEGVHALPDSAVIPLEAQNQSETPSKPGWLDFMFAKREGRYPFALGLHFWGSDSPYSKSDKSDGPDLNLHFSLAYNYFIKNFFTTSRLSLISGNTPQKNKENYDLTTVDNKTIRVVKEETDFELSETSLEQLFGYQFKLSERLALEPYVGLGYGVGEYKVEKKLMTDKDHWQLFSEHNRYTLTSTHHFRTTKVIAGLSMQISRFFFNLEAQWRSVREKSLIKKQSSQNSEPAWLSDATFGDIAIKRSEKMFMIGGGVRF